MSIYEQNLQKLVGYMEKGCKNPSEFRIGMEIEHFVFDAHNHSAGYDKIVNIMKELMTPYDKPYYQDGYLIGYYNDKYSITLEPAAQLEISITPCQSIESLKKIYNEFRQKADKIFDREGLHVVCKGYNPYERADELPLIPKKRYEYMDEYFRTTGTCGINMMRATASVQVSIDYSDAEDASRKYRLACILSPILSLIMDNSDVFDGKPYRGHLLRAYIWNNVDADRCTLMKGCLSEPFGFEAYARTILDMPAILIMENKTARYTKDRRIRDIYREHIMTTDEIEHVLSMAFFDVRMKNYIEIRMADSCTIDRAADYARLIQRIFYDDARVEALLARFEAVTEQDVALAVTSLIKNGYDGCIYGISAGQMAKLILE